MNMMNIITIFVNTNIFLSHSAVMRLGKKKEKDRDTEKEQCIDNVARLICSPKQHLAPLRGKYKAILTYSYESLK